MKTYQYQNQQAAFRPYGRVQSVLIASRAAGDLVRRRYPGACTGKLAPQLTPVFTTDEERYTLVRVA